MAFLWLDTELIVLRVFGVGDCGNGRVLGEATPLSVEFAYQP